MIFTVEEENLLCIFITPPSRLGGDPGDVSSRNALIGGVRAAMPDIDEPEMREIAESALSKLHAMTDAEFDALDFCPAYYNDETEA